MIADYIRFIVNLREKEMSPFISFFKEDFRRSKKMTFRLSLDLNGPNIHHIFIYDLLQKLLTVLKREVLFANWVIQVSSNSQSSLAFFFHLTLSIEYLKYFPTFFSLRIYFGTHLNDPLVNLHLLISFFFILLSYYF